MIDKLEPRIRKVMCELGFHEWESRGKLMPLVGNYYKELFVCKWCLKVKKVVTDEEIMHLNW